MNDKLPEFEANLVRLMLVSYRLMAIHHEFPNQMKTGSDALFVRSLFREVAIEQLHNFIRIRSDLIQNLKFKKLDDIIKEVVEPILQREEPIAELRHNYVAHIQEDGRNFKVMMNDIVLEYDLPTNWAYWSYLCGLAFIYYGMVENNFSNECNRAEKLYYAKSGVALKITSGFEMEDVVRKMGEIVNPIQVKLDENGYQTTIKEKEVLEKLRKHYSKSKK